ncbi:MAG: zf-HC2 domain-containing protein [Proteobacteria bacterium]|jgi:hypothetical protein|nr:zf-HC2 domain-containing protein [Pseudomonadota bacterium]
MSNLSCREFERSLGDYAAGAMPADAKAAVDAHLAGCRACREALALWSGIGATLREIEPAPLPPLVERRCTVRAIGDPSEAAARPARRTLRPAAAFAAALAASIAAVAIALYALSPRGEGEPAARIALAPRVEGLKSSPEELAEILPDGRTLVHLDPATDVWLDPGTHASFDRIEADDVRIALHEGRLVADIGPHAFPYRFVVATPSGEVEAKGTIFIVEVIGPSREVARVLRGVVEVRSGLQRRLFDPFLVFEGQQGIIGETGPGPIPRSDLRRDLALLLGQDAMEVASWLAAIDPGCELAGAPGGSDHAARARRTAVATGAGTLAMAALGKEDAFQDGQAGAAGPKQQVRSAGKRAGDLVALALIQRQAGDYGTAASTYRQIVYEYEGTMESLASLVSLGQLELYNLGRATTASTRFEAYVERAPNGTLAEEARLGLVRAYDRSNRVSDIERAATDYLAHHRNGFAAPEVVRTRADARRLTGNCEGAREDYMWIRTEWPSSHEATIVDAMKGACAP